MQRFDAKVVLVTGASSGIGRATALALGREGARVVAGAVAATDSIGSRRAVRDAGGVCEPCARRRARGVGVRRLRRDRGRALTAVSTDW